MELEQIISLHMFQLINRYIMAHLRQWSPYLNGLTGCVLILRVAGISLYLLLQALYLSLIHI